MLQLECLQFLSKDHFYSQFFYLVILCMIWLFVSRSVAFSLSCKCSSCSLCFNAQIWQIKRLSDVYCSGVLEFVLSLFPLVSVGTCPERASECVVCVHVCEYPGF